ncbi:methyltransferase domain-containing protein [Vibrio ostreicida]|nr:methyltransferase domain-containing protein [Vibrio ostreicida]
MISNSSFQWFKDYDASLKAMRRCLAPNGRLVIETPYR